MQADGLAGFQPGFAQLFELAEQVVVVFAAGQEEQLHQALQALAPHLGSGRLGQGLVGVIQCIEQGDQRADQRGVETADFVVGLDAVAGSAGAYGVTEQHPTQAESPAVLFQLVWQSKPRALFRV